MRMNIRRTWARSRGALETACRAVAGAIGLQEVLVVIGLIALSAACWEIYRPAAYGVPGAVLLWWSLPSRPPFITRDPESRSQRS